MELQYCNKNGRVEELHQQSVNSSSPSEDSSYISRYLTDFEPVHILGEGGFGVVFEAKNKIDDCHYAIKQIYLSKRQKSRERVMREVKALAKLDHQNIVRYFNAWVECPPPGWQEQQDNLWNNIVSDYPYRKVTSGDIDIDDNDSYIVFESLNKSGTRGDVLQPADSMRTSNNSTDESSELSRNLLRKRPNSLKIDSQSNTSCFPVNSSKMYLFIQMQLCRKESLKEWLSVNVVRRDFNEVLNIFEQIVQAVEYVHSQGLIHRDLKPSNIFFSLDGQIKVGDFGLVTAMIENSDQWTPGYDTDEKHTAQVGTQPYMSPEQISGRPYNYKVDIYSLGLILFELLVPFNTQMERVHTFKDLKENKFPADFQRDHQKEYNLLRIMLSHNPEERPTTIDILLKIQVWRRGSSLSKSSHSRYKTMVARYSIEERRKIAAWMELFQSPSNVQEKFKAWTGRDAPSSLTISSIYNKFVRSFQDDFKENNGRM